MFLTAAVEFGAMLTGLLVMLFALVATSWLLVRSILQRLRLHWEFLMFVAQWRRGWRPVPFRDRASGGGE